MPGIGIINNPHSRKNRKHPDRMEALAYIVGSQGESVATQDAHNVREVARRFREQGIDILGINGGDGSNHVTLTAFIEEYEAEPLPVITFLRGGTMNTISNACGIKGTQAGLLMNLIHKHRAGLPFETIQRDTLCLDGRYGFLFGNGLVQNFLEAYYATGKPSPWMALRLVSKLVGSAMVRGRFAEQLFEPFRARVTVDGRVWPHQSFTAVLAATVHQIGLGFRPFFRCEERPHSFHFLGVITRPAGLVRAIPKLYVGKKVSERKILETVAEQVLFESDRPMRYTLDGDTHQGGTTLRLTAGPRLTIIVR